MTRPTGAGERVRAAAGRLLAEGRDLIFEEEIADDLASHGGPLTAEELRRALDELAARGVVNYLPAAELLERAPVTFARAVGEGDDVRAERVLAAAFVIAARTGGPRRDVRVNARIKKEA